MSAEPNQDLTRKVARAMEAVLSRDGSLTYPSLLVEMGALTASELDAWRRGRTPYLERVIHMKLTKLSRVQTAVRRIAREQGLSARPGTDPRRLRYSKTGHPFVEREYARVYRRAPSPPGATASSSSSSTNPSPAAPSPPR